MIRYQTISAAVTMYSSSQAKRAAAFSTKAAPLANWWLNASAIAR